MIKYFKELSSEKIKLILLGVLIGVSFKIFGLRFFIGVGILGLSYLAVKFFQKNFYKGRFKIHYKDICK